MNRIIKFRAWDGHKMYEPCVWMGKEYIPGRDTFIEADTLMQFTGLFDKNKTPIYDGDIVISYDELYIVYYSDEDAAFVISSIKPNSLAGALLAGLDFQVEVIGNIFQNPELLKP